MQLLITHLVGRKAFAITYLLFACLLLNIHRAEGQAWETLGDDDFNQAFYHYVDYPSLAIDHDGAIYVAGSDGERGGRLTVRKFNGNKWLTVGNPGFSDSLVSNVKLVVDNNKVPYVIYSDYRINRRITVKKLEGNTWKTVDEEGLSVGIVTSLDMICTPSNEIFISFIDIGAANKLFVYKLENGIFVNAGPQPVSSSSAGGTTLAFDSNNKVHVAFSQNNKLFVKKLDGSTWSDVASDILQTDSYLYVNLVFGDNNEMYISYNKPQSLQINIVKYDGNSLDVIDNNIILNNPEFHDMKWRNGKLYVVYSNLLYDLKTNVIVYENNSWNNLGPPNFSIYKAIWPQLDFQPDGTPVVSYRNHESDFSVSVKAYSAGEWINLSTEGLTNRFATTANLEISETGDMYMMSDDAFDDNKFRIRKYDQSAWVLADNPLDELKKNKATFKIDNNGRPVFANGDISFKMSVYNLVNSTWGLIGDSNFSFYNVIEKDLAIGAGNELFVCYNSNSSAPGSSVYKIFVQHYDGVQWEAVGQDSVTIGIGYTVSMIVNQENRPVITYPNFGDGNILVKKFNGTAWELVGGISDHGEGLFPSLKMAENGDLILTYVTNGPPSVVGWVVVVKRFSNNEWTDLTPDFQDFLTPAFMASSISVDAQGSVYLAYAKKELAGRLTVKKYENNTWTTLGQEAVSEGAIRTLDLEIDTDGLPVVMYIKSSSNTQYQMGRVFAKKFNPDLSSAGELTMRKPIITLFPNPCTSELFLKSETNWSEYTVFDALGNKVLSGQSQRVDVKHLPSGIYFINVHLKNGGMVSGKFVKL